MSERQRIRYSVRAVEEDDDEPDLGVREPRRPKPPSLSGGAAAPLRKTSSPDLGRPLTRDASA